MEFFITNDSQFVGLVVEIIAAQLNIRIFALFEIFVRCREAIVSLSLTKNAHYDGPTISHPLG